MNNEQNPVTQTEEKTEGTVTEPVKKTEQANEKTFSQEEVNALLIKAEEKINKKYEKYKNIDLDAYNSWAESQKTEAQKQQELLQENEELKQKISYAENKSVVANADVDLKFQKFVLSEVSQMEGVFEDNLKEYLKNNPQYLQSKDEAQTKPQTTGYSQKGNVAVDSDKAYLDKKYANNPYYKK